ncbi:MAG: S66 peptidase family protein [Bacteroidia bacterium]
MALIPPFLKEGSIIGITATARKVSKAEIEPAIALFQKWGLQVKLSSTLFCEDNQFAGTDTERAKGLQELLNDDSVEAIIIARGGYGNVRMIDLIDFSSLNHRAKWIIGFSDITVLQSALFSSADLASLHAPMAFSFQPERFHTESAESLRKALFGEGIQINVPIHDLNTIQSGAVIEGELIGGNLSVLYSLLGSQTLPNASNKILFLEDLDEYLYHIDRMMMGLKRAGFFKGLKAVLIGDMSDMKDNAIPFGKNALEIIHEHIAELGIPLVFGLPCGHEKMNLCLAIGAEMKVEMRSDFISLRQL